MYWKIEWVTGYNRGKTDIVKLVPDLEVGKQYSIKGEKFKVIEKKVFKYDNEDVNNIIQICKQCKDSDIIKRIMNRMMKASYKGVPNISLSEEEREEILKIYKKAGDIRYEKTISRLHSNKDGQKGME